MMMDSDDEDYFYFDDDVYGGTSDDNDWYDDYDDCEGYGVYGVDSDRDLDYERYKPEKMSDQQAIYKELNIPNSSDTSKNPSRLLDICASKIALIFPFAYVEDQTPPIPEDVQLKIISYSFPQNVEKIKRYCSLSNGSYVEFEKAIGTIKSVKDLTQFGFHLSANVECRGYREVWYGRPPGKKPPCLYVNVKFDRGKITETDCPCESTNSWCSHVIAVCLARIFMFDKCTVEPPMSDMLNNLTSLAQMRTFTQYLIAEHKDRSILETARNVLNRMLKPHLAEADAIKETWGAPDPTAGPGLDEVSNWLICEEGLKTRCIALIQSSDVAEGCWGTNLVDLTDTTSVMERWKLTQIEKPVVEDYFSDLGSIPGSMSYSYNHNGYRKAYSREKGQEISKFLQTCEELIKDDFEYSLKAVQTFTVQLMDVIEEWNKRMYNIHRIRSHVLYESNFHLGCTPTCKPHTCWLFRDQLARLWRLLVLNPSISRQARDEIFTTLEVLEAKLVQQDSTTKFNIEWDSQKHLQYLKNFSWEKLHLTEDPFKNESEITTSKCLLVESSKYRASGRFPYPVDLTCGHFSTSVTVFCYLVEALSVYGKREQAVHLAMNVALAVVRYYSSWLDEGQVLDVENTFSVHIDDGDDSGKKNKGGKKGQGKRQNRKRGRAGAKKLDDANKKFENCTNELLFDQVKGIIPITCIAYLMDILDQNQELLAEMLKLVKIRGLGLNEDEMMECDDVTYDARSFIFRLGVIGLAMPKIQAPSLQLQIEWFNWEVYVSQKLMKSTPSTADTCFLTTFTHRMIGLAEFGFHPPYALVTNLFHHSVSSGLLDEKAEDCVSVVLGTITASPWKQNGVSIHRRTFLECLRRHWVKLCEAVLCRVSTSRSHLSHALECIFTVTDMIGSTCKEKNVKAGKKATTSVRSTKLNQSMFIEKIVANLYMAYALVTHADGLQNPEDKIVGKQMPATMYKPLPPNDQRQLLYETAITIVSRAFSVKNVAFHQLQMSSHYYDFDHNFLEFLQRSLRWMCGIHSKIGLRAFEIILDRQIQSDPVKSFNEEEVIRICTTMLESDQKRDDRVWISVRDALLALVSSESEVKISDILQLCRNTEKESPSKRVLLVPAICKELLMYIPSSKLETRTKSEYLARAMTIMYTLLKKLENDDEEHDTLEGVKELFSEGSSSTANKPSTSHDTGNDQTLDSNHQLCFDLTIETMKHFDNDDHKRNFETKRRYENICDAVGFVSKRAVKNSEGKKGAEKFSESCVTRFIDVLCNNIRDYLLLTDFFFELTSRLADLVRQGSFGRDRVMLSDDCELDSICQSSPSLSVLLKRCIAGLVATTEGELLDTHLKDMTRGSSSNIKSRVKHAKFYCGASLVEVLRLIKRLMSMSQEHVFEPDFSYRFASKSPVTKVAIEELNNTSTTRSSSPERYSENHLISSLLLRRMFSPAFGFYDDYDMG